MSEGKTCRGHAPDVAPARRVASLVLAWQYPCQVLPDSPLRDEGFSR